MRPGLSLTLVLAACLPLAGCYYDPGYGYVRNGSGGDAYYGEETTTTVVSPGYGYADPGYGYYDGGYAPGYTGVSVGTVWYDHDGRRYYRDRNDRRPPPGGWRGRPGDGDHRPPGGWQGGDHRPPGGWQGGDHRPPGGWQGGDHRPPGGGDPRPPAGGQQRPPGGWHGGDGGGDHRSPPGGSRPPDRSAPNNGSGRDRSRFRSTTD